MASPSIAFNWTAILHGVTVLLVTAVIVGGFGVYGVVLENGVRLQHVSRQVDALTTNTNDRLLWLERQGRL